MNASSLSGREIHIIYFVTVKIPQRDVFQIQETDVPQKSNQSSFENLLQIFLCSLRNGNKQDQKQHLSEIYHYRTCARQKTHGQPIRRNQFLESVQYFAESQGLVFGKHLQNIRFDASLRS